MRKIILSAFTMLLAGQVSFGQVSTASNSILSSHYVGSSNSIDVVFKTNAAERMRLTTGGFFGMGTTTPTGKLDMLFPSANTAQAGIRITTPNMFTLGPPELLIPELFHIRRQTASGFITHFIVKNNGNTGIGTEDPKYKLHVINTNAASGTAVRVDAINGHMRFFETDGSNPNDDYTQLERNGNAFHIYQWNSTTPGFKHVMTATTGGTIGFGTATPEAAVHILSNESTSLKIETSAVNNADIAFKSGSGQSDILNYNTSDQLTSILRFNVEGTGSSMAFTSYNAGSSPVVNFKVAANGITYAKEIIVQTAAFPDYVFADHYQLMSLQSVSDFIKANKHLPNIPSANEVVANGIAVGDMQVKQMEKIEELYLHLIQMEERLKSVELENAALKKQLTQK